MKSANSTLGMKAQGNGQVIGAAFFIIKAQRGQVQFQHRNLSCISVYAYLQDSTNTFKDLCVQGMILDTNIFFLWEINTSESHDEVMLF